MPLIKNGRLADDPWVHLDDEAPIAPDAQPIVSLERWQAERDSLLRRNAPLGIRLKSDQAPSQIADDVKRFAVIALDFPKFTDGRAYSSARLLRERYGFEGELRAVGHVLRDQFYFMLRCGFDAFEVADARAADDWLDATGEISVRYQPAGDDAPSALSLRRRHPVRPAVDTVQDTDKPSPSHNKRKPRALSGSSVAPAAVAAVSCAAHWAY